MLSRMLRSQIVQNDVLARLSHEPLSSDLGLMAAFLPCANGKLRTTKIFVRSFGKKPSCPSLAHAELRTPHRDVRSSPPADDLHGLVQVGDRLPELDGFCLG